MNRETMDFLHPSKRSALQMMFQPSDPNFTLAAQAIASSLTAQAQPTPSGKGMVNASSGQDHGKKTSLGTTLGIMQTESQSVESGAPGRRGRRGNTSDSGLQ